MGILSGNPKNEPLHYGEVYSLWMYLHGAKSMVAGYQTMHNHAGDEDLREILMDLINNCANEEIKELENLMKDYEIPLPPAPPERPKACLEDIPVGARFMDQEIASVLAADNAAGLVMCSKIMGQCIREDIAAMFAKYHGKKAQYGLRILRMNKEKGWLIPPPLHKGSQGDC